MPDSGRSAGTGAEPPVRDAPPGFLTRLVLALAGALVPRTGRAGWRREWEAELAAARERGRSPLRLALGAVPDAWAVRRLVGERRPGRDQRHTRGAVAMGDMAREGAGVGVAARDGAREIRRAARSLGRAPGFTLASVVTLAVGIGATAALVTLVDAILLRPLPYPAAERVVRVYHTMREAEGPNPLARFAFAFIAEESRSFEAIGGYWSPSRYTLTGEDAAERVPGVRSTPGLLDVLGARPLVGRLFTEADAAEEGASGVLLSQRLWERRYGADPSLIGRSIMVEGRAREVLGVLAPGADLPREKIDVWIPYVVPAGTPADDAFRIQVLARLRPGVDVTAAEAEMQALTARFPELGPFYRTYLDELGLRTGVRPIRDEVVGAVERPLWILLGAVLIVLLVAAANVATLFLVRAEGRRQEVAVRAALGARRAGLVGHFLAESLLVALAAGAAGLAAAAGAVRLFVALAPPAIPRLDELALRWPTGAVVLVLCLLVALLLGVYPFLRFGRGGFASLRGRASGESRGQSAVGGGLVVAQVALALVLLSGSALLLRTFQALRAVDPGFEPEGVLVAEFSLPATSYPGAAEVRQFQNRLLESIRGVPGVEGAAIGPSPLGHGGCNGMYVEGMALPEGQYPPCIPLVFVSPGYLELLGISPVSGRTFEPGDLHPSSQAVAVVSDNVARRLWPGADALRGGIHPAPRRGPPWFPVVGVAEAVRGRGPDQPPTEAVYLPLGAMDDQGWLSRGATVLVKSAPGRETELAGVLRRTVAELDRSVPLTVTGSLAEEQARVMSRSTFTLFLLATAAATALVLGLVGLYGVVAYRVGRRRPEIGLRMAMGARPRQVRMLVLRHSMRLVGLGLGIGLVASLVLTRTLSSLLFGVRPSDPVALAAATAALLATAALASWIPARHAARIDPATTLRES